jgi:hypothetical protein
MSERRFPEKPTVSDSNVMLRDSQAIVTDSNSMITNLDMNRIRPPNVVFLSLYEGKGGHTIVYLNPVPSNVKTCCVESRASAPSE